MGLEGGGRGGSNGETDLFSDGHIVDTGIGKGTLEAKSVLTSGDGGSKKSGIDAGEVEALGKTSGGSEAGLIVDGGKVRLSGETREEGGASIGNTPALTELSGVGGLSKVGHLKVVSLVVVESAVKTGRESNHVITGGEGKRAESGFLTKTSNNVTIVHNDLDGATRDSLEKVHDNASGAERKSADGAKGRGVATDRGLRLIDHVVINTHLHSTAIGRAKRSKQAYHFCCSGIVHSDSSDTGSAAASGTRLLTNLDLNVLGSSSLGSHGNELTLSIVGVSLAIKCGIMGISSSPSRWLRDAQVRAVGRICRVESPAPVAATVSRWEVADLSGSLTGRGAANWDVTPGTGPVWVANTSRNCSVASEVTVVAPAGSITLIAVGTAVAPEAEALNRASGIQSSERVLTGSSFTPANTVAQLITTVELTIGSKEPVEALALARRGTESVCTTSTRADGLLTEVAGVSSIALTGRAGDGSRSIARSVVATVGFTHGAVVGWTESKVAEALTRVGGITIAGSLSATVLLTAIELAVIAVPARRAPALRALTKLISELAGSNARAAGCASTTAVAVAVRVRAGAYIGTEAGLIGSTGIWAITYWDLTELTSPVAAGTAVASTGSGASCITEATVLTGKTTDFTLNAGEAVVALTNTKEGASTVAVASAVSGARSSRNTGVVETITTQVAADDSWKTSGIVVCGQGSAVGSETRDNSGPDIAVTNGAIHVGEQSVPVGTLGLTALSNWHAVAVTGRL